MLAGLAGLFHQTAVFAALALLGPADLGAGAGECLCAVRDGSGADLRPALSGGGASGGAGDAAWPCAVFIGPCHVSRIPRWGLGTWLCTAASADGLIRSGDDVCLSENGVPGSFTKNKVMGMNEPSLRALFCWAACWR